MLAALARLTPLVATAAILVAQHGIGSLLAREARLGAAELGAAAALLAVATVAAARDLSGERRYRLRSTLALVVAAGGLVLVGLGLLTWWAVAFRRAAL